MTTRLMPLKADPVLVITLKKLYGRMYLKTKPPLTKRFWLGFCGDPVLPLDIESIISDKQLKFGMIIQVVEHPIHDIAHEVLAPNASDYPFFPSYGTGDISDKAIETAGLPQESVNQSVESRIDTSSENDRRPIQNTDDLSLSHEEFTPGSVLDDKRYKYCDFK